ncbi:FHY3/FAR1 family [Parasponia andersonii]|uniref:FHY3/FAR1 family n=1 Tax=Parasponia andersonii TaxID=3476 RepID=A0A2P5BPY3_PARAD|nr:FHY3/FAR1 family [Parasponia andersonii]
MAGLKSPTFFHVVLVIAVVVMAQTAEAQVCSSQLSNLNVCAPFVVPGSANPQPSSNCCSALGAVNHDCLCNTLRIASRLPALCNIPALACGTLLMDSDDDDFGTLRQENMDVELKTSNDLDLNVEQDYRSQKVVHANGARASESEEAYVYASRRLDEVMEGVEKILRLKPEEAQAVTSSSTGANASESEHTHIYLDRNAIEDQDDNRVNHRERAILDRGQPTNLHEKGSTTNGIPNVEALPQSTATCISSSPPVYVSPQATMGNPIMQGLYNFEANQAVKCMYQQPNMVMDQHTNANIYQQPNFFTNQHESPSHSQLLQEPLIHSTYPESVSNTTQLRQEMDLDIQHPHSASFLLFDQRYRASDTPYLGNK